MWDVVHELQRRVEELSTNVARLQSRLAQAEQSTAKVWQSGSGSGTGSAGNALWCRTPGALTAATGTWPNLTPYTFTADVYSKLGASSTLVSSGATIRWIYKDTALINKLVPVVANDDGTFDALADSCSAV